MPRGNGTGPMGIGLSASLSVGFINGFAPLDAVTGSTFLATFTSRLAAL